jgi:hypothetical protein
MFTDVPQMVLQVEQRCERCPAEGQLAALIGGIWLGFCGHHGNKYAEGLRKSAVNIVVQAGFKWRGSDMVSAPRA